MVILEDWVRDIYSKAYKVHLLPLVVPPSQISAPARPVQPASHHPSVPDHVIHFVVAGFLALVAN